ncbi:MAG TPA: hypothetical protein VGB07_05735 [Blastocatellia bacterium]
MVRFTQFLKQTFAAALAILFLFSLPTGSHPSQAAQQERTYTVIEQNNPNGVFEIKKVNNLQSASFPEDLEVEVKNISNKPIYFIYIAVTLPETGAPPLGFHLEYGRREISNSELAQQRGDSSLTVLPEEKDVPILPGESAFLRVKPPFRQDMVPRFKDNDAEYAWATRRAIMAFQRLSFGDGTGYVTSHPYPVRK